MEEEAKLGKDTQKMYESPFESGIDFEKNGDFEEAIKCFKIALETEKITDNMRANCFLSLGICHKELQKFEEANEYLQKIIEIGKKAEISNEIKIYCFLNFGFCYIEQQNFGEAIKYFNKTLEIIEYNKNALEMGAEEIHEIEFCCYYCLYCYCGVNNINNNLQNSVAVLSELPQSLQPSPSRERGKKRKREEKENEKPKPRRKRRRILAFCLFVPLAF